MQPFLILVFATVLAMPPIIAAIVALTLHYNRRPKVGVAVIIEKNGKILLGKRTKKLGAGTLQLPGGHLEMFETWETCASREVREETNLQIKNVRLILVTNNIWRLLGKHYITVFMAADWESNEAIAGKGHESAEWSWYDANNIPKPLFESSEALEKYLRSRAKKGNDL